MKALIFSLLCAVLPMTAFAGEHPAGHEHPKSQEHPKGEAKSKGHEHPSKEHPAKEHPAKNEHPEGASDVRKAFTEVVTSYIKGEAKKGGGALVVKDEASGMDRMLQLTRLHKDKIVKLSENEAFACADFKTVKGGKDKLDLDFYVSKSGDGWKVSRVIIHKVNAKPRYTYNDANEMVPVKP